MAAAPRRGGRFRVCTTTHPAFSRGQPATACVGVRRGRDEQVEAIVGVDQCQLMVEHFAAYLRGEATLRCPPQEAAASMRIIEALLRSARDGGCPQPVGEG